MASYLKEVGYKMCKILQSPFIFQTSVLMEPFFAQMFGCLLMKENIPSEPIMISSVIAVIGYFTIISGSFDSKQSH